MTFCQQAFFLSILSGIIFVNIFFLLIYRILSFGSPAAPGRRTALLCACGLFFLPACFSGCVGSDDSAAVPASGPAISGFENGNRYYYYLLAVLAQRTGQVDAAAAWYLKAAKEDPGADVIRTDLAELYARANRLDQALATVEEVLRQHPENPEALLLYARLRQNAGKGADAAEAFETLLRLDPEQREVYLRLGAIYLEADEKDKAWQVYHDLVERYPDAYAGHFYIGKINAEKGRFREAEAAFLRTLDLEPELEEPRFELVKVYESCGMTGKVETLFSELLDMDPDNLRAQLGLAYFYCKNGYLEKADGMLKDLAARSRTDPDVARTLTQYYIDPRHYEAAAVLLERMLKTVPDAGDLRYLAGVSFDGMEKADDVIRHFSRISPDSRFYPNAILHIAFLRQENGALDQATALIREALKHRPDFADFYVYLASFYEQQDRLDEGIRVLETGIKKIPDNDKLHFRLGVILDKSDRKTAAIEQIEQAVSLNPQNPNALNYLGYTFADMGIRLKEAEGLVQKALQFRPEDGYIIDSLGWVYFQQERYEDALRELRRAVTLVDNDPVILEHLGDAYAKLSDWKNALKYYRLSRDNREGAESAAQQDLEALLKKIRDMESR